MAGARRAVKAREAVPAEISLVKPAAPWGAARRHVLVVDDVADNRQILALFCEQFGLAYDIAEDGLQAVEAARSGRFDLILMDIHMPRMDGMHAARAIRALPGAAAGAPIIAISTSSDPAHAAHYRAWGMTDVVTKPIQPSRLLEAVTAALSQTGSVVKLVRAQA